MSVPQAMWSDPEVQSALARFGFGLVSQLVRSRSGLRQEDLAAMTGLSQAYLSSGPSGRQAVGLMTAILLE